MAKKKQKPNGQRPKTIEEAVAKRRPPQNIGPQSKGEMDQVVQKSLAEMDADDRLEQRINRALENQSIPVSSTVSQPVTQNSTLESVDQPPQMEIPNDETIAAMNEIENGGGTTVNSVEELMADLEDEDDLRDAEEALVEPGEISLDEFKEQMDSPPAEAQEDPHMVQLRNYVTQSQNFPESFVGFHLQNICANPATIPLPSTWEIPQGFDLHKAIYTLVRTPGYVEALWPTLKVIMGSNSGNPKWCAGVLITLALFDVIKTIPFVDTL